MEAATTLDGRCCRPTSSRRARQDKINGRSGADKLYGDDGDDDLKGDGTATRPAPTSSTAAAASTRSTASGRGRPRSTSPWTAWRTTVAAARATTSRTSKIWTTARGKAAGSAGNDYIYLFPAASGSTILGLGGDDVVKGGDGDETIDGGAGADSVIGGRGNDTLTGGAGPDRIFGDNDAGGCGPIICSIQSGSDTIEARDGERDVIDCGVGNDTARVDAGDVVSNCETVETGGSPPAAAPAAAVQPAARPWG